MCDKMILIVKFTVHSLPPSPNMLAANPVFEMLHLPKI